MTSKCRFCNFKANEEPLLAHERQCPHRLFKCPAPRCSYQGKRDAFLFHLTKNHEQSVLNNADKLFADTPKFADPIDIRQNQKGDAVRLGSSQKFYCNQSNKLTCRCCDETCGPYNGCNCFDCMKLDLERRRLPKGYLVNCEGAVARKAVNGRFYCGRWFGPDYPYLGGGTGNYCGPNDGPNCSACRRLERVIDMYQGLM